MKTFPPLAETVLGTASVHSRWRPPHRLTRSQLQDSDMPLLLFLRGELALVRSKALRAKESFPGKKGRLGSNEVVTKFNVPGFICMKSNALQL